MLFQSIPQHLKLRFRKDSVTSKYYCTWPFIIFSSSLILIKMSPFHFQNDDDQKHSFNVTGFFPIIHNLPLLELPSLAKNTKSGSEVPIILLKKIVWADNSQARQTQHFVWSGRWGEEKNKALVSSPLFWLFPRSLYAVFSLNFSSVGKGPFMDGKAKNIYFSKGGGGGEGTGEWGKWTRLHWEIFYSHILRPILRKSAVVIFRKQIKTFDSNNFTMSPKCMSLKRKATYTVLV